MTDLILTYGEHDIQINTPEPPVDYRGFMDWVEDRKTDVAKMVDALFGKQRSKMLDEAIKKVVSDSGIDEALLSKYLKPQRTT